MKNYPQIKINKDEIGKKFFVLQSAEARSAHRVLVHGQGASYGPRCKAVNRGGEKSGNDAKISNFAVIMT